MWQEINGDRHSCHWWQDLCGGRLSAMTTIILVLLLIATFAALGRYASRDRFGGPEMRRGGHPDEVTAASDVLAGLSSRR